MGLPPRQIIGLTGDCFKDDGKFFGILSILFFFFLIMQGYKGQLFGFAILDPGDLVSFCREKF